ncbi:MAG: hypothetical protein IT323_15830 [Anaerolineae bacterium]|nr:hypothetical protein [Anaerolineae bacterium]
MITDEIKTKLERIANHTRQSTKFRNEGEAFVREMTRQARDARIHDVIPVEHIEGLAAEHFLLPLARSSRADYPLNIIELAAQRRNHKMMLKLLRHPDDMMRIQAAEQFQIMFAMLDGYFDEASALVNQILLVPTEIPEVKYALLRDAGRTSRRGLPREIADTARRLIHDLDQGVSYHALRLLSYLHDVRDWRAVLDRMITLVGEDNEAAAYFLWAGVEYLEVIIPHEPAVVEWIRSVVETYPPEHMAVQAVHDYVVRSPEMALQAGLINRREYREMTGK